MYFTLAVSAATAGTCARLTAAARVADPRAMPLPGPAELAWQAPDGRAAVLHWGQRADGGGAGRSQAGSIWAEAIAVHARTAMARVDPVYLTEVPGAVVLSDRASWAAAVAGRLRDVGPVLAGAFLSLGYPVGGMTPFRGVRALRGGQIVRLEGGRLRMRADHGAAGPGHDGHGAGPDRVASALTEAVRPLGEAELSLTGGKDSRLVAAALVAAGVPFRARTHGFPDHPDVIVAGMIASRLGLEHTVTEPAAPGSPGTAEVLGRIRATVLVSDGMLSAFENVGRPDRAAPGGPVQAGGHGGELLRGGYAQPAWGRRRSAAAAVELFRRMTTRRVRLLRPAAARAYLTALAPSAASLTRGPLRGLDDFYLVNRAGRWSAAARQAYLIRSPLAQPLFADPVVRAARAMPLQDRLSERLHRDVLARLCPELLDIPLAGRPWQGEASSPGTVVTGSGAGPDWRRELGPAVAAFLRGYVLDSEALFTVVSRAAAERALSAPLADPQAAWALATLAALMSGDWLNARETAPAGAVSPRTSGVSRGRTGSPPARSTAPPPRA
jgi:hypothetical protein